MKAIGSAIRSKLSYSQKLLLFVVTAVLVVCSFVFGYFVVNMRRQMSDYVRSELNQTMNQTVSRVSAELENLQRIMYTNMTDTHLWQRLSMEYTAPMGTWELYDYVNKFYDTLLMMDDRIVLVTIYVDNPTIAEDKTYIRHFDYFEALPVYDEVMKANGAVVMYPMKDVFPEDYYTYNQYSSTRNFCLMRSSVYRGVRFGIVLEFSRSLFTDHLSDLYAHQICLLDPQGKVKLYFNHSEDRTSEAYDVDFGTHTHERSMRANTAVGWEIAMMERIDLMDNVDKTIARMTLYAGSIILLLMLVIVQFLWRMTARLRSLDATIQSTMAEYGGSQARQAEGEDELDQVLVSLQALKDRIDYLMNEVMETELAHRDAELRMLYSQIKPHFLYNTLSGVMSLARRYHDERLENMISSLSDMYRISLNRGRPNITVADEICLTRSYLYIIQNRFDDMLQVTLESSPEIEQSVVPKVILQPFVENCVTHAILEEGTLHIQIRGVLQDDEVVFTIQDDGPGIAPETIRAIFDTSSQGVGFGVRNVHQRIQLLYGNAYGVTLQNAPEGGTLAILRLPFCREEVLADYQKQNSIHTN